MLEVDLHVGPFVEPERRRTFVRAEAEQGVRGDHVAAKRPAPGDPLELSELLERIDADVRVGADAEADAAFADALDGEEAVAEVRLGREAGADPGAGLGEEVELAVVRVRGVDDRRARPEAAGLGEELDRPDAVLLDALVDLAWLLVGVDVEGQGVLARRSGRSPRASPAGRRGRSGGRGRRRMPRSRRRSTWFRYSAAEG